MRPFDPSVVTPKVDDSPRTPSLDPRNLKDMLDYRLYLVYREFGDHHERMLNNEFGINRRRWRLIATVHDMEGATLSDIAEHAELDKAQASRTVGTMVREGLLKRLSNPDNARFAKIVFTDKGRELYDKILIRYREMNLALVDALTVEEIQQLDKIINKLRAAANSFGKNH
ncbi:MarR family winged helix-turn-helix transcriptional regulator [Cupriavidus sp. PET2-C1]